jgi:hypothetical protein
MEAEVLCGTLFPIYQTSQDYIQEDHDLNIRGYEKQTFHIDFCGLVLWLGSVSLY